MPRMVIWPLLPLQLLTAWPHFSRGEKLTGKIIFGDLNTVDELNFFFNFVGAPKSWLYQTWIYVGLMAIVKLITTLFIQLDIWDNVKNFVLSPFKDPRIELAVVMLVIPFFVNVSLY